MSKPLVLDNVSLDYRRSEGSSVEVLRDFSLALEPASTVAIVGPSGSGKSSLLNIAGLLMLPTSGDVVIEGVRCGTLSPRRRALMRRKHIGFVFQRYQLFDRLTALENVVVALHNDKDHRSHRLRAAAALEAVGLADRLTHRPGELSGGQQQRVALARALVTQPTMLLCDEPTGNLDEAAAAAVIDLILHPRGSLREQSIVMVTHDRRLAQLFDRQVDLGSAAQ